MNSTHGPKLPLLIVASAVAGHFMVVTPLVDGARARMSPGVRCPAVECTADGVPVLAKALPEEPAPMMVEAGPTAPWSARFEASSRASRDIWRGELFGTIHPAGGGLVVELRQAKVILSPEAPQGVLRGLRLDLAEPTADGSWRIVREGRAVDVGIRFENGETRALAPVALSLPGVTAGDLAGRWLLVTMLVSTPGGFAPLAHVHMEFEAARGLAETAMRAEKEAPAVRVR